MSPDVESEPSQSFSSIGVNDSMENLEFDSTIDALKSISEDMVEGSRVAPPVVVEKESREDIEEVVVTPTREMGEDLTEDSKDKVAEAIADTIIDDSDVMESSVDALRNKSIHEKMDISKMIEHGPTSSTELTRGASAPVLTDSAFNTPNMQSMRGKLQSLISELATATLSREEVNVFEDMFWEAKEKLYGAGRRGREES